MSCVFPRGSLGEGPRDGPDQSALLELLEALKAADVDDRIPAATTTPGPRRDRPYGNASPWDRTRVRNWYGDLVRTRAACGRRPAGDGQREACNPLPSISGSRTRVVSSDSVRP